MKQARLPWMKTLEQFDYEFQASIDRKVIRELSGLGIVDRAKNVVLLGPPGVGKTHLAIALAESRRGWAPDHVPESGKADESAEKSSAGKPAGTLDAVAGLPQVLVLDETGYFPISRDEAILTSNKSYADWGEIFGDQVIATAILDRLLHHATTVNIKGESYRLKEKRKAGLLKENTGDS